MTDVPNAPLTAADVRRRLAAELSLPSRLGHTALLLVALTGAGVVGALLLTEPALPPRTRVAFTVMLGIGLSWAAFAAWVLARRRVLLAGHRVVAARMAIAFTALFTVGASLTGFVPAVGVGLAMLAAAVAALVGARRRVAALEARRAELERLLAARGAA